MNYEEKNCPGCGEYAVLYDDVEGTSICENCGFVVAENIMKSDLEIMKIDEHAVVRGHFVRNDVAAPTYYSTRPSFSVGANKSYALYSSCPARAETLNSIHSATISLQLSKTYEDQITNKVLLYTKGKWKRGHGSLLIVYACAYIVCRQNNKPISLTDVADLINVSPYVLGRVYSKILQELNIKLTECDPALFIERAISKLNIPPEKIKLVNSQIHRLLNTVKDDSSLATGRRAGAICAASIMLAIEANELPVDKNLICLALNVALQTACKRHREMRKILAKIAIDELPFIKSPINEKNVTNYLPSILQHLEFKSKSKISNISIPTFNNNGSNSNGSNSNGSISDNCSSSNRNEEQGSEVSITLPVTSSIPISLSRLPPSFAKTQLHKQYKQEKINIAKLKLSKLMQNDSNSFSCISTTSSTNNITTSNNTGNSSGTPPSESVITALPSNSTVNGNHSENTCSPAKSPTRRDVCKPKMQKRSKAASEEHEHDLLIEKLVLLGVPDQIIIDNDYATLLDLLKQKESSQKSEYSTDSSSDIELSERDLPDEELINFLRTPQEIKLLQDLEEASRRKRSKNV